MIKTNEAVLAEITTQAAYVRYLTIGSKRVILWDANDIQNDAFDRKPGEAGRKLPKRVVSRHMLGKVIGNAGALQVKNFGPFRYIRNA